MKQLLNNDNVTESALHEQKINTYVTDRKHYKHEKQEVGVCHEGVSDAFYRRNAR